MYIHFIRQVLSLHNFIREPFLGPLQTPFVLSIFMFKHLKERQISLLEKHMVTKFTHKNCASVKITKCECVCQGVSVWITVYSIKHKKLPSECKWKVWQQLVDSHNSPGIEPGFNPPKCLLLSYKWTILESTTPKK